MDEPEDKGTREFAEGEMVPTSTETSTDIFRRLGKARVIAACDKIRLIGNLSAYEHTEEQVEHIKQTLINAIAEMELRFKPKAKKTLDFEL